jgi:hypothetical protein
MSGIEVQAIPTGCANAVYSIDMNAFEVGDVRKAAFCGHQEPKPVVGRIDFKLSIDFYAQLEDRYNP